MVDQAVHYSSQASDWETPPELVSDLLSVFRFDLDVCASRPNVCDRFYSPQDDGLSKFWHGLCWMNSPYSRKHKIGEWMSKALSSSLTNGATVVCLPPARTSTRWWHATVPWATLVVFIKGRLHFRRPGAPDVSLPAPFPSAFVVFGPLSTDEELNLRKYGWSVTMKGESKWHRKQKSEGST